MKRIEDRLIADFDSPLLRESDNEGRFPPREVVISGNLGVGKKGNPVTVVVEDEVTGESLEINHVGSAFLMIEDRRKNTAGWLAIAVGGIGKLNMVLGFLAEITLDGLKKMVRRG